MAFNLMEHIGDARSIGITGHIKPDGDCIGSGLALLMYLRKRLPEARVEIFLEQPERAFDDIPGRRELITDFPKREPFDVFIVVDTNSARTGDAVKYFEKAKKTINIDHHISNKDGTGMVNYVVPEAAAAGEIIYGLLAKEYIDSEIAELLFMAIAHDTGVFRFSNTTPKTLRAAAQLMEYRFDHSRMLDDTFFSCSVVQNRLVSQVLLKSRFYLGNKLIVGSISLAQMTELGATTDDTGTVVERLRNTEHVRCAVFLYEKTPGMYKASLRSSTDSIDVAKVGEVFGGGGHRRASGCTYTGSREEFEARLVEEIAKQI